MIVFLVIPYLVLGCAVFLICALIRPLRRYALSASLWCIALTPWLFALMFGILLCASVFNVATEAVFSSVNHLSPFHLPGWTPAAEMIFGYILLAVAVIGSLVTATLAAILHQVAIHRLTLALFRIYVASVASGVAILSSFFTFIVLSWVSSIRHPLLIASPLALLASLALVTLGYKLASQFRGDYPARFPIVTPHEFASTDLSN